MFENHPLLEVLGLSNCRGIEGARSLKFLRNTSLLVFSGTLFEISLGDICVFETTPALMLCALGGTKVTGKFHRTFF